MPSGAVVARQRRLGVLPSAAGSAARRRARRRDIVTVARSAGPSALQRAIPRDRVEDAASSSAYAPGACGAPAVAEQPLEDARGLFPSAAASSSSARKRVQVDAAVAGIAVAVTVVRHIASSSDGSGVSLPTPRRDLVGRDAGVDVGAFGALRVHAVQPLPLPRVWRRSPSPGSRPRCAGR